MLTLSLSRGFNNGSGRADNPYAQQSGNPYGQQGENTYVQQSQYGGNYNQGQTVGRQPYGESVLNIQMSPGGTDRTDYTLLASSDVEMVPIPDQGGNYGQNGAGFSQQGHSGNPTRGDSNAILNECREIDRDVELVEKTLVSLVAHYRQVLNDPNTDAQSSSRVALAVVRNEIMTYQRNLAARVKRLKSLPESGSPKNGPQVGRVERKLRGIMQQYQTAEMDFRKQTQTQMAREYRITTPEATDEQVQAALEDTSSNQIFSQAVQP